MDYDIITLKVEDHDNFIHIIADRKRGEAAVVDPAWDAEGIAEVLHEEALRLSLILITHTHYDHINAVDDLRRQDEQIAVFINTDEYSCWPDCPQDAILVADGEQIAFGSETIEVITTPGHTIGGCCYRLGNHLFTGDTLFLYGCGRADLKGGNPAMLYRSLAKLKRLPRSTIIHPGHDYSICETTTLGEQIDHNPFLMLDDEADFIRYRMEIASKTRSQPYTPMSAEELRHILTQYT